MFLTFRHTRLQSPFPSQSKLFIYSLPDLSQYLPYDELSKKSLEMSPWNAHKGEMSRVYQKGDSLRCYTYIASSGMCLRANNVAAYCEANRQVRVKGQASVGNFTNARTKGCVLFVL